MNLRKGFISYIVFAVIASLILGAGFDALAFPTLAGTPITNQARVSYADSAGRYYEAISNVVETIVSLVPGVDISDGRLLAVKPGGSASYPHTITNTGNAPDTLKLDISYDGSFTFSLWQDVNGDGKLGPEDLPLVDSDSDGMLDTGLLLAGQSFDLIFRVEVPADAALDILEDFILRAQCSNDELVYDNATDELSVDSTVPYLDVYGSPQYSYLGSEYEYRVGFGNSGDTAILDASLEVPLPIGIDFVSAEGGGVYNSATRTITWALGAIEAGGSGDFLIGVKVVAAGAGITYVLNRAILNADAIILEDTEPTGLVTGAPVSIVLVADPDVIIGDGRSTSLLTAYVYDILGNPVPDGTPVTFQTAMGRFRDNARQYFATTTLGSIALAVLVSPMMSGFEQIINTVEVVAGTPETGEAYDFIDIVFTPGGIIGVVVDSQTGFPVSGILVELFNSEGIKVSETYTDGNGRYLLVAPSVGEYIVKIHVALGGQGTIDMPVTVLELFGAVWSTDCAILGTVLIDEGQAAFASNQIGLANADVYLYKDGVLIMHTVSDSNGDFSFAGLERGDYIIKAISSEGQVGFRAETLEQDGEIIISAIIRLFNPGLVYDRLSLAPIPGAEVTLYYASGPSEGMPVPLSSISSLPPQDNPVAADGAGRYIFFAPEGNYVIKASAFGYADYSSEPFYITGGVVNPDIPMDLIPPTNFILTKSANKLYAAPGERVKFTLIWSNTSGASMRGVELVDLLPEGLEVETITITAPGYFDSPTNTIRWNFGNIGSSSDPITVSFYAMVLGTLPDGTEILNRAQITDEDGNIATAAAGLLIAMKPAMTLTKQAGSSMVSTGDIVSYKITVMNSADSVSPMAATGISIVDRMPEGFLYLAGSSYLDGESLSDPSVFGGIATWLIGDMQPGEIRELTYKLQAGVGSLRSDGVNTAMLYGYGEHGYLFEAGPATAKILVTGPAFSSLGAIIGKLYHDKDDDGIQDPGEEGISGAEVMLDDGMRAITDREGQYHIGQVKPGLKSIKVNVSSLPSGMTLSSSLADFLGLPSSKFIEVYPSSVVRADFALVRDKAADGLSLEMAIAADEMQLLKDGKGTADIRLLIVNKGSSAIKGAMIAVAVEASSKAITADLAQTIIKVPEIGAGQSVELFDNIAISGKPEGYASLLVAAAAYMPKGTGSSSSAILAKCSTAIVITGELIPASEPGFSITAPQSQSVSYLGHIGIITESRINVETALRVNGKTIPGSQIGTYTRDGIKGLEIIEYINVGIDLGRNLIELIYPLTSKVLATATVFLPGNAERVLMVGLSTDNSRTIGAQIAAAALAVDSIGLPAGSFSSVAFAATGASFTEKDMDSQNAAHQAKAGRFGNYDLMLSITDTEGEIALASMAGKSMGKLDLGQFALKENPGFAVGTLELVHNLSKFSSSYIDGRVYYRKEFQGAVFIFRYDPSQNIFDGMFSDAAKDGLYDTYGDLSQSQNAAPSAGPFYVKLQTKYLYAMWGDFQSAFEGLELSGMRTKLTGFAAGFNIKGLQITGFAAPKGQENVKDRIEANGTSGFFFLSSFPIVSGSETVYAIKTLYYDEEVIADRRLLLKGKDYQIDYSVGSILLSEPLPSYDLEGNKYFIEVDYKIFVEESDGAYVGARAKASIGPVSFGASVAADINEGPDRLVAGAELGLDFGDYLKLSAEGAASFDDMEYGGFAVRAGISSKIGKIAMKLEGTISAGGFVKLGESASMPRGASLLATASLDEKEKLILSFSSLNTWKGADYDFGSVNNLTAGYRLKLPFDLTLGTSVKLEYAQSAGEEAKGMIVDAFAEVAPVSYLSFKAVAQLAKLGVANDSDGDFSLSATYKPNSKLAIILSYVTGMKSDERYHTLVLSGDFAVNGTGKVLGKLSLPFGGSGRGNLLSLGYKDSFLIAQGLKANVSIEGQTGFKLPEFIAPGSYKLAASAALEYTAKSGFRAYAKQEVSYSDAGFTSLTMLNLKGDAADWLALEADAALYSGISPTREGLPLKAEARLSAAIRPDNTAITGLLKLEGKYFSGERLGTAEQTGLFVASTDWTLEAGSILSLAAKAAYKMVAEGPLGYSPAYAHTILAQGSASLHIAKRTDLEAYVRAIGNSGTWKVGYSVQLVQGLFNNLSLGLGYNSKDLSDTDISDQKPWTEGFYLKLMLKF